jgi:hypothetical protein
MPTIPDDLALTGTAAARLADQLLRQGRPFHAHEVLEASWKSAPPNERDLWQGLAQIAVGLTHAHRGNPAGAVTLLSRGARRVRTYCAQLAQPTQSAPSAQPAHPTPPVQPAQAPQPAQLAQPPQSAQPAQPAQAPQPAQLPQPVQPARPPGEAEHVYPYDIDIAAILTACDVLAARIDREGLTSIPAADLLLKLITSES